MKRMHLGSFARLLESEPPGLSKTGGKGGRTPLPPLHKHALPVVHVHATPDKDVKIFFLNVAFFCECISRLRMNSAEAFIHKPAEVEGSWGMGVVDCI